MNFVFRFFLSLILAGNIFASQFKVEGKVYNIATGEALSYANIRIAGSMAGVSANAEGSYQLNLNPGTYRLIASYIGYKSDTLDILVEKNIEALNFSLTPIEIRLHEITVVPGNNPAIRVIREAIGKRKEREKKLKSYEFEAYTKGVIKTSGEVEGGGKTLRIGSSDSKRLDSLELAIRGILENHSKGFYKQPDKYKEVITAQKQTSNFSSSVNTLTGGRLVQSFYSNDLKFFDLPMTGPISDDALNYYYYYISDSLAMDNYKVLKIYFEPDNKSDPGFRGNLFIKDSTFDLLKVDVELNRAANIGGLFDTVRIFQQFLPYKDNIYMPIDYRLFLKANLLGLIRIGFEMNSIMYNYEINNDINDNFFNKAILTVETGADKKDSLYWSSSISIPNTLDEVKAYKKIDSAAAVPKTLWKRFTSGLLSDRMEISNHVALSSLFGAYHFNRVEGHALDYGIFIKDLNDKRINTNVQAHYGFSDKKFKSEAGFSYLFGDYRTYKLSLTGFNKLETLFPESDKYNEFFSTVLALFSKYEFRNYYYTKGFNAGISGDVFPVLNLGINFSNRTDNSAVNNSDYSFFAKNKTYRRNLPIYETRLNMVNLSFKVDFRDYIEDGYFRERTSLGSSYIILSGSLDYSGRKYISSDLNFKRYNFGISGELNTYKWAYLYYKINGTYSDGTIPYQMLYAFSGNIDLVAQNNTFRTIGVDEYFGDRAVTIYLEHNFGSELFRRIPIIKDLELQLSTYINAGWLDISDKSKRTIPAEVKYSTFRQPLYEAGFSIGHILFPFRFEFTWRLNHKENNPFVFGLSTPIF